MSYTSFGEEIARPTKALIDSGQLQLPILTRLLISGPGEPAPTAPSPDGSVQSTYAMTSPPQDGGSIVYIGLGVAALALGGAFYAKYRKRKAG
jgi:LPXTG-motif cell wall-anchored protein